MQPTSSPYQGLPALFGGDEEGSLPIAVNHPPAQHEGDVLPRDIPDTLFRFKPDPQSVIEQEAELEEIDDPEGALMSDNIVPRALEEVDVEDAWAPHVVPVPLALRRLGPPRSPLTGPRVAAGRAVEAVRVQLAAHTRRRLTKK